jgi:hypothetical protein
MLSFNQTIRAWIETGRENAEFIAQSDQMIIDRLRL